MDLRDREELCNTGPDEETVARERRRSRRVSFAEITSVHVFDRDEEYDTPPDSKPNYENQELGQSNEALGFNRDFADNDSSRNEDNVEDEDEDDRELFVRSMYSSSPGSAVGSAASNDEDNFFGPVSASFIRSGCLSDSAASDDNHEITLDSTAFSMHFQSLVQSDSGGNLKTPTGVHINFEDKVPTQSSIPSTSGSSKVLTEGKKLNPSHTGSGGKSSAGSDSNNMSLVEANPHRYDYGRLSPTLDALLAGKSKNIGFVSVSDEMSISKSSSYLNRVSKFSMVNGNGFELLKLKDFGNKKLDGIETLELVNTPMGHTYIDPVSTNDALPTNVPVRHPYQNLNEARQDSNDTGKASAMEHVLRGGNSNSATTLRNSLQMNSTRKCDNGHIEDPAKEESPNGGSYTPDIHRTSTVHIVSPNEDSMSSLRAKRPESFVDVAISSRSEHAGTPFARNQPYSSSNADMRPDKTLYSIKNIISKSKVPEISPLDAMLEVGDANSKTASIDHFSKCTSFATMLDSEDPKLKHMDFSVIGPEDHFSSLAVRNREKTSTAGKESYVYETPKIIEARNVAPVREEEGNYRLSEGILYDDQASEMVAAITLPFQFSGPGKGMGCCLLTSQNHNQGTLVRTEPDSSSTGTRFKENMQIVGTHGTTSRSPLKRLEEKFYASTEREDEFQRALDLVDEFNKFDNLGKKQSSADALLDDATIGQSTPIDKGVANLVSSLGENRAQATLPFLDINIDGSIDFDKLKRLSGKYFIHHKFHKETGNTGDYQTPLRHDNSLISKYGGLEHFRTRTDPSTFKEKTSERASFYGSSSPDVRRRTATAIRLEKRLVEVVQSSSRKETHNLLKNENAHPIVTKSPLFPGAVQSASRHFPSRSRQHFQNLQETYTMQDVDSYGRKRRIEEIIVMDNKRVGESGSIHKVPKVALGTEGSVSGFESQQHIVRENDSGKSGGYGSPGSSVNVFLRFFGAIKGLLLPSAGKLSSWKIGTLEDILGQLQKAKKYEMLCLDIQSQRMHDHLGNLLQERVAKARRLQQMVIHEQAKFQLLRLKQERLLRKVKLLQSGIVEAHNLKFSLQNICISTVRNAENKGSHRLSFSDDFSRKHEVAHNEVLAKRQALGDLDEKVKKMTKLLLASCKTKGERSPSETAILVNDHLRKRRRCSYIHQELQLCQVDDFESKNGCHSLVISYCHFLFQRFTVNLHSVSTLATLYKLNDVNILKSFPNINACKAFAFVFNAVDARKLRSSKSYAVETQITCALLGNLLDVVEEVERACIELRNLIKKSFHSSCSEQLELQLCFINLNTGHKVTVTLDMTCLKCAVYPSDILPTISLTPASQTLSAEIGTTVGALKAGYSRIIRLCRCISHMVQASSR